mmetsp:Transcript_15867/g.53458  ORF Transcript_15867/g.53458 Transcript_15867/m.53458 type:complete len:282 (+) Transcript_15867:1885-2730(+)
MRVVVVDVQEVELKRLVRHGVLRAVELVVGDGARPRAREDDGRTARRRVLRFQENDGLGVDVSEQMPGVCDLGRQRLRRRREVLHEEQLRRRRHRHVVEERSARLFRRRHGDEAAAGNPDAHRLRVGAVLERPLVHRAGERAGALLAVAGVGAAVVVDLVDRVVEARVRRGNVEEAAGEAVQRELFVLDRVVRPGVCRALLLLKVRARVPDEGHVGGGVDGDAAAAEAQGRAHLRRRRRRVVDAGRPDGDAHLRVAKVRKGLREHVVRVGELGEIRAERRR